MAGLMPQRRTREQLERANDRLIQEHREYLQSWIRNDRVSSTERSTELAQPVSSDPDGERR